MIPLLSDTQFFLNPFLQSGQQRTEKKVNECNFDIDPKVLE